MKKFFAILLTIVFSASVMGIIGGLAAEEKVKPMVKDVVIAKTVTSNIYSFINENLSFLGVDEDTVNENVAKVAVIDQLIGCYCEGAIYAIGNCNVSTRKINLTHYLDTAKASSLISEVLHNVVNLVIDVFNLKLDFKEKLMVSGVIAIAGKTVVGVITNEIEKRLGPKILTVETVLKIKLYLAFQKTYAKIILGVIAVLSLVGAVLLGRKKIFSLGRSFSIAGIAVCLMIAYTSWHTPYKIKKTLDITVDLNLEKWYIFGGGIAIIGGIIMIIGYFSGKKKYE